MEKPKRTGGGGRMGEDMDWVGCGARCGTDHLPEIGPAGLPFLVPPPPNLRRSENGNGKQPASRKRNAYFMFNLLIINDINQYFNIHLHLISFIIYNR